MLRQQTEEEKRLWEALSGDTSVSLTGQFTDIGAELHRIERALRRELWNIIWWRYLFSAIMSVLALVLMLENLRELLSGTYQANLFLVFGEVTTMYLSSVLLVISIKPSARWKRAFSVLVDLSKKASAAESIRPLLRAAQLDHILMTVDLGLYERLAQVLTHLTDFTPNKRDSQFLQRVMLTPKRYPDSLRLAALLILGDQPTQLNDTFLAKLKKRQAKEQNEGIRAVIRDILSLKYPQLR